MKVFSLVFFITFLPVGAVHAHDGWIEVAPSIVEKGQPVTIALMHGNHSNEHRSYRLAGKWDPEFTKVSVVSPSGKTTAVEIVDLGEDPEKTGPKGPKGFHIAQFVADEEGVHTVVARQERDLQRGDGPRFRGVRFARSAFAALALPTVAEAQKIKAGAPQARGGDDLEIVPVDNGAGAVRGAPVTLQVRYKGKPAEGKVVSIVPKLAGAGAAQDVTTDALGRVTFAPPAADFYLARVKFDEKSERGDLNSFEATYVFQVFNRR
ncbi:MAG TPA: DUF4198 domain-containing protein [Candidatus Binatia bacterium]|nr:DUF4198 domain-containing protein [Candidatus Binatia bacterium]